MAMKVKKKVKSAKKKLEGYLNKHDIKLKKCKVIVDTNLEEEYIMKRGYPNCIIVNRKNVAESSLAYYLINITQNKLQTPVNIKYLYSLITEGLADYVVSKLYSRYDINNLLGCKLIRLLICEDENEDIIFDLFKLNSIKVESSMVDTLMESNKVDENFKALIKPRLDSIRQALEVTDELDLTRSNYLPFGEEFKAWRFIIRPEFNPKWQEIQNIITEYYEEK